MVTAVFIGLYVVENVERDESELFFVTASVTFIYFVST